MTVVDTTNVGKWIVHDGIAGDLIPISLTQFDANTIALECSVDLNFGRVGYTDGDVGGMVSANGFLDSDSGDY